MAIATSGGSDKLDFKASSGANRLGPTAENTVPRRLQMRHLGIAARKKDRGGSENQEADAHSKYPERQISYSNSNGNTENHHAGIVVVIIEALLRGHSPLKKVCAKKKQDECFRKSVRGQEAAQAKKQSCEAGPSNRRIADQVAEHAHGGDPQRPGVPGRDNERVDVRGFIEAPHKRVHRRQFVEAKGPMNDAAQNPKRRAVGSEGSEGQTDKQDGPAKLTDVARVG